MVFSVVWRGVKSVGRFSGRDTVGQFWIYCGAVLAAYMVAGMAVVFTTIIMVMLTEMPPAGTPEPAISPVVPLSAMVLLGLLPVVLLSAAVARRLHDRNRSALWGLPTLLLLISGIGLMLGLVASITNGAEADFRIFAGFMVVNMTYLLTLALLIVQLVQRGTAGPNRFGDDPAV